MVINMELRIKVNEIDYDSLIKASLPVLKKKAKTSDRGVLKLVAGILEMPGDIPLKMLSALSKETKDEIVIYLVEHYKENIILWIQKSLLDKGIVAEISDIEITKEI